MTKRARCPISLIVQDAHLLEPPAKRSCSSSFDTWLRHDVGRIISITIKERFNQTHRGRTDPLPLKRSGAFVSTVDRIRKNLPFEDMSAVEVNAKVVAVYDAAGQSVRTGRAINLPLKRLPKKQRGGI